MLKTWHISACCVSWENLTTGGPSDRPKNLPTADKQYLKIFQHHLKHKLCLTAHDFLSMTVQCILYPRNLQILILKATSFLVLINILIGLEPRLIIAPDVMNFPKILNSKAWDGWDVTGIFANKMLISSSLRACERQCHIWKLPLSPQRHCEGVYSAVTFIIPVSL